MRLYPLSHYAHALKPALPRGVFAPARGRLAWLPVHVAIIAASAEAIVARRGGWPLALVLAVAIGHSFAGLTFLAHETLHGSVVRSGWLRRLVGWVGFLPFAVSPRLWVTWHNKIHHGHTGEAGVDPDAYPTLAEYRRSRLVRVVTDHFSLGHRCWTGILALPFGFTFQSVQVLATARALGVMSPREHGRALAETALGVAFWAAFAFVAGARTFLLAYALPLLVANTLVMAFILANHSLSPLTDVNDPLVNSLSVTVPRPLDWTSLRFGWHVEHHLFPSMSSRHAPVVRALILARWPDRYQSMSLWRALGMMCRTGRVYSEPTRLCDPRSGLEWPALTPAEPEGARRSALEPPRA